MKIKGLDFLRVFGILLVLIYHYFPAMLPAGFLGVNVLFVLSGFLISFHLIDELFENKKIDYQKFYSKRFVRIFPGLLLMLFLTTLFIMTINPDYSVGFFDQFLAAISFNYNYFEILRGGSYEGQFITGIFMNTWTLALEIHFYLIWPWIMGFIYKKSLEKRAVKRRFTDLFLMTTFYLAIIGFVLMLALTIIKSVDTGFVYFFDLSRMGSFMVGSFLAAFVKRFSFKIIPYNKATLIGLGLILLMAITMSYASKVTYFVGFALTDLISGFLILVAYSNKNIMEDKITSRLSDYSYGFYLFHWPVWIIVNDSDKTGKGLLLAILITIALVLFNYHVFEPIFRGKSIISLKERNPKYHINYEKNRLIFQSVFLFMIITSFSLSFAISENAGNMMSLEKQILRESVNQDIEKINLDKKELDQTIDKNNSEFVKSAKKEKTLTLIGDSVMLGPREYLANNIENLYINAEGSRPLEDGASIITQMDQTNNLGDIVIMALGTNAEVTPAPSLEEIVRALPDGKRLILVTCYDNRYDQPHRVSVAMNEISKKYDFITVMDWEDYAIKHPAFYNGTDGVHFYGQMEAYEAYLKLLNEAIEKSLLSPVKGE